MTETKWTPGPWDVDEDDFSIHQIETSNIVAECFGPINDLLATARLIAAAPDLYTSVERLLLEFDVMIERGVIPDVRDDIIFDNARAAMRKARGNQ